MQTVTLLVAALASTLVFLLSPIYGLIIYIASFSLYPTYLSVPLGTIDFTLCRIVILAIFAKLFLLTDLPNKFRFIWLDKTVIIFFIAELIAGLTTTTSGEGLLENLGGAFFDMAMPYFTVRLIVRNKQQYLTLLKAILLIAAPLAIVGLYECLTGSSPLGFLMKYYAWRPKPKEGYIPAPRSGFFRACVTFPQPIMFGLFFAMLGSICTGILGSVKKHKALYWIGLVLMAVGVFSSMSMGPLVAASCSIPFIAFYRWRKYWKPAAIMIIVMCGLVEIISNGHFYNVIGRFSFSAANTWYRSRLIEVALFEGGMSGHWLTGFGYNVDPGWHAKINPYGFPHTDILNHYLVILCRFGLFGFIPFLAMNVAAVRKLLDSYRATILNSDKWLIWCLSAGLFGIAGAAMSISLFGPPIIVYYMMIGFASAMPDIVTRRSSIEMVRIDTDLSYNGKSILTFNNSPPGC